MSLRAMHCLLVLLAAAALPMAGCTGTTSLLPNPDPTLNRRPTEFAADAARRFPYKADAPRGDVAPVRAHVGYMLNRLEVVNLSQEDWQDAEIWVNAQYVCFLPKMEPNVLKRVEFTMLYDAEGRHLPLAGQHIKTVEMYRDGRMYPVRLALADTD